ncbi:dTDP-4-dehydrorhamnose reductase [Phyllobacterium zundukense]|uniref:dTDP-4-dehydrorhamnose reductase n=1 Tax=Phyllobacterium zundukense TaxID=1867719 RepID=A0A2N9VVF1_9HYPH|nr:dTDP-4-dehydrorhamnose reductase [Phyllobacterium zundukense]ATU94504.1 dTDP-4-dehydrorhamnose reductase [Phyllobacterium zundukense]PIO43469.1 dTDP-4-dehydrorhamnose reductase [Phyllobacterium zundukense]
MRIVVTGREGQVVRSLVERAALHPSVELLLLGRPELDLAQPETVFETISATRPDLVVSAAAYTAVDQAEDEPELAHAVNAAGAGAVAQAAADIGAPIIHLSTDYVFSGDGNEPYTEDDPTGPRSIYGQTKLDGEVAVAAANPRHLILRTAWVYSPFGKNFVKTMLRLAEDRDSVSVVADQWGNPTSALDIADGILCAADRLHTDRQFDAFGIYHLAGTGSTNWSSFARAIFKASQEMQGPFADVADIRTSEYPTKARRPLNSRLSTAKFHDVFGWRAPQWEQSMETVVEQILQV